MPKTLRELLVAGVVTPAADELLISQGTNDRRITVEALGESILGATGGDADFKDITVDKSITLQNATVPANTSSVSSVDGVGFRRLLVRGGGTQTSGAWIDLFGLQDTGSSNELQLGFGGVLDPQLSITGDEQQVVKRGGMYYEIISANEFFSGAGPIPTPPIDDLNSITETGNYKIFDPTLNIPPDITTLDDGSVCTHLAWSEDYYFQIFYNHSSNQVYTRKYVLGIWGAWDKLLAESDIVNNLTTADSTKTLAATQGLVLKSLVDNNETDITTLFNSTGQNALDIDALETGKLDKSSVTASLTSSSSTDALAANQAGVLNDLLHQNSLWYFTSINFDLNVSNDTQTLFFGDGSTSQVFTIGLPSGSWSSDVFERITLVNHGPGTLTLDIKGSSTVVTPEGTLNSTGTIDIPVGGHLILKRNTGEQWHAITAPGVPIAPTVDWLKSTHHLQRVDALAPLAIGGATSSGSIGPTGSGAGTIWADLDAVQDGSAYAEIALTATTEFAAISSGDLVDTLFTFKVVEGGNGGTKFPVVTQQKTVYYDISMVNNQVKCSGVFKVPLNSSGVFDYEISHTVEATTGVVTIDGNSNVELTLMAFGTN